MKKLALLGNGRVAGHYKKIFQEYFNQDEYKFTHLIDINNDKLQDSMFLAAEKHSSIESFLNCETRHDVDFCLVSTPSHLHFEHAKMLMLERIIPIVEKPPVLCLRDLSTLTSLIDETSVNPIFIFQNRLNPAVQFARKVVSEGRLGKIVSAAVVLRWCREDEYYDDDWHGRWELDGGVSAQQGIHHLDALQYILGPLDSVQAEYGTIVNKMEAEDTLVGIGKLSNSGLATIELTVGARPADLEASLTVTGTMGNLRVGGIALNKIDRLELVNGGILQNLTTDEFNDEISQGYGISHYRQFKQIFSDTITPPFHLKDVEGTVRLLHCLLSAAETGKRQYLMKPSSSNKLGIKNG